MWLMWLLKCLHVSFSKNDINTYISFHFAINNEYQQVVHFSIPTWTPSQRYWKWYCTLNPHYHCSVAITQYIHIPSYNWIWNTTGKAYSGSEQGIRFKGRPPPMSARGHSFCMVQTTAWILHKIWCSNQVVDPLCTQITDREKER